MATQNGIPPIIIDCVDSREKWDRLRTRRDYDYVIVGSSFCAMGFIHQIVKNTPDAKILILERGKYEKEFQDLPPIELGKKEKETESNDSWECRPCEGEKLIKSVRGMNFFFGGRSLFWKAWCPQPKRFEMAEWPEKVIESVEKCFPEANQILNVRPVNEIKGTAKEYPFGQLQKALVDKLQSANIKGIMMIKDAPIAVEKKQSRYGEYKKYSVIEPLLKILKERPNISPVQNCTVKKILHKNGKATTLETSAGDVTLGNAKLILAMSTLPSTTLMLNSFSPSSFKHLQGIGKQFTGHFVTDIRARVPLDGNTLKINGIHVSLKDRKPEMAAIYVVGENKESKHQFHIQITAVAVTDGMDTDASDKMRILLKTPSDEQLSTCKNHLVFICASLGQLDHNNPQNRYELNDSDDITRNATLHLATNEKDRALWDTMDQATYKVLDCFTSGDKTMEYWNKDTKEWQEERPERIRMSALVHPASTMPIGDIDDGKSPVDLDYRFRGVDNVYLTGGALWPTGAAWNPTCAMTALAMDLADKLTLPESKL